MSHAMEAYVSIKPLLLRGEAGHATFSGAGNPTH